MAKPNVSKMLKDFKSAAKQHSPEILMGVGITGMITTTVLAVKATPKALRKIDEAKDEMGKDELTRMEVIKVAWKPYIPAVTTGVFSTACLIGSASVNARRNAALTTAYKLSETALVEYREKVVETIGEKKEKTIRDKVAKDKVEKNPVNNGPIIVTGKGNTLCFDPISSRYFKSDIDKIKRAENELNKEMLHQVSGYVTLNEFYDEIGLDHVAIGDELGWNAYHLIDISFSSQLSEDGEPAVVLDFANLPKYKYDKF